MKLALGRLFQAVQATEDHIGKQGAVAASVAALARLEEPIHDDRRSRLRDSLYGVILKHRSEV